MHTPLLKKGFASTRMTDPEALEARYPVVVEEFSIRRGSGGKGAWSSGEGTRRVIRFLEDMEFSILSGNRRVPLFGVDGGEQGQTGRNSLQRADGSLEALQRSSRGTVSAGDRLTIETPTGGGFGRRG